VPGPTRGGGGLLLVLGQPSGAIVQCLLHRVVFLTEAAGEVLLTLEAVTVPDTEVGASFAFDTSTDRLLRMLPDADGVSVVWYEPPAG
jgi:pentose-5-phosphate-3-epimerase